MRSVVLGLSAAAVLIPPGGSVRILTVSSVLLLVLAWTVADSGRLSPIVRSGAMSGLTVAAGVCGVAGAELTPEAIVRYFIFLGYLLVFLAMTGRPVVAVVAFVGSYAAMAATLVLRTGLSLGELLPLAPFPQILNGPVAMVTGLGWLGVAELLRGRLDREESEREAAAVREAAALEKMAARSRDLAVAFAAAEPILRRAAAGVGTADDRRQAVLVEAALRDRLRAPRLAQEPLSAAVSGARDRGVEIDLLDDGPPDEVLPHRLLDQLTDRVTRAARGDRITIRLNPPDRPTLGSLLVDRSDGSSERRSLLRATSGEPVTADGAADRTAD